MKQFYIKIDKYANMFINVFVLCIDHHAKSVQAYKKKMLVYVSLIMCFKDLQPRTLKSFIQGSN